MRPKFLLTLGLLTFVLLGGIWFLRQQFDKTSMASLPVASSAPEASPTVADLKAPAAPSAISRPLAVMPAADTNAAAATLPNTNRTSTVMSPEERAAEIDRLQEWGMNNDSNSLNHILADLPHSDKEVRAAAIEAAKQFGSADAIPALKAAADSAEDTGDKIAYLEAADFLALPSLDIQPTTPEQAKARFLADPKRPARSNKSH
jgi:hypothetical protein